MLIFKQLFDQSSGSYSYLLADTKTRQAVFIDTVYEQHQRDLALIQELELQLVAGKETHCHADHVTGAWLLKNATSCQILASDQAGIQSHERKLLNGENISFTRANNMSFGQTLSVGFQYFAGGGLRTSS